AVPAAYRTLFKQGVDLSRTNASLDIVAGIPKRLFAAMGVAFKNQSGVTQLGDLAFVSVDPDQGGDSSLLVIDVTDALAPIKLSTITLPQRHGLVQSIIGGEDGLLHVATSQDVLLLDPQKITEPQPQSGVHPALVGFVAGIGSGARSFATDLDGLNVVNL